MTYMTKTQVYLPESDLAELRRLAKKARRSSADMIREAIRKVWLAKPAQGPVALWTGPSEHTSIDHDSIYDAP